MENELFQSWLNLASKYSDNVSLMKEFWEEIYKNYASENRHYHNLQHISHLLKLAENNQADFQEYDMLRFAIWYHDIIYNATKSNNELESAEFAQKRLKKFKIDTKKIGNCADLIISTKKHEVLNAQNEDNAYLLDFDLAILATSWESYENYCQNIRKEYSMFPDFLYKKGRKKVLQHFLERPQIYHTQKYRDLWEAKARENIQKELTLL